MSMTNRHQSLKELLELLAGPIFTWRMASRNDRKGSPLAEERALDRIELLILAWAKPRLDAMPPIIDPMDVEVKNPYDNA